MSVTILDFKKNWGVLTSAYSAIMKLETSAYLKYEWTKIPKSVKYKDFRKLSKTCFKILFIRTESLHEELIKDNIHTLHEEFKFAILVKKKILKKKQL